MVVATHWQGARQRSKTSQAVRRSGAALIAVVTLSGACSLITAVPELTGGPAADAEPPTDSSLEDETRPDATDGSSTEDQWTEGSSPDGGGADADANADVDARPRDSGPFSCDQLAPPPLFCDDFDNETTLTPRWTGTTGIPIAPTVDNKSLLARVPDSGTCRYSTADKTLPGSYRASRLAYWVRFGDQTEFKGGLISDQYFDFDNAGIVTRCHVVMGLGPVHPFVLEQVTTSDGGTATTAERGINLTTSLAPNVWHPIVIDFDLAAKKLMVSVDDQPVLDDVLGSDGGPSCPGLSGQPAGAQVGLFCTNGTDIETRLRVDNLTFDAR